MSARHPKPLDVVQDTFMAWVVVPVMALLGAIVVFAIGTPLRYLWHLLIVQPVRGTADVCTKACSRALPTEGPRSRPVGRWIGRHLKRWPPIWWQDKGAHHLVLLIMVLLQAGLLVLLSGCAVSAQQEPVFVEVPVRVAHCPVPASSFTQVNVPNRLEPAPATVRMVADQALAYRAGLHECNARLELIEQLMGDTLEPDVGP